MSPALWSGEANAGASPTSNNVSLRSSPDCGSQVRSGKVQRLCVAVVREARSSGLLARGGILQVAAHAQQQQDVHGEQVEDEQQRRALAGAEGHSQHPRQPRAAAPRLRGRRSAREHSYHGGRRGVRGRSPTETYASAGSFWRLHQDGGFRGFVLRAPRGLAVTYNHKKRRQLSHVRQRSSSTQQL